MSCPARGIGQKAADYGAHVRKQAVGPIFAASLHGRDATGQGQNGALPVNVAQFL